MNQKEVKNITIQLFDPDYNKPRLRKDFPGVSVDVFTLNRHGEHGLAFFSFEDEKWYVHTETFVGYVENTHELKWMWYYPPIDSL